MSPRKRRCSDVRRGRGHRTRAPGAADSFSGPLDLLLYLVRRAEVDIADVPIAEITDQFVAAVSSWAT